MAKKPTKPKQCPVCPKTFIPQYSSLQQVCSPKCAVIFNSEKEVKKRVQQMKVEVEGTNQLEKAARLIFQKWIRERDKDLPCISCGRTSTKQWDAGHMYKAELFTGLIFDERNANKQCSECNGVNMHGNVLEYHKGLIKRYGQKYVDELDAIADENRMKKFSRQELIDIANKYKMKLKELQKED
jgi:predicted nucleic acid-binding Zn ribbon protein